ncbi:MAG TPA: heme-binding domain-containing protein [Caldilineaceae bacterium]|nr:heme-binding domain-containing protein [Caldilineaceae bacterium]
MKKIIRNIVIALIVVLVLIQLIPIDRTNPAVTREVQWNSPETRAIAQRACYDCHSNETVWPWYSYVAPVSLRVADHVAEGREHLNFSEWDRANEGLEEILETINKGEMPLSDYLLMHPEAKLTAEEQRALTEGLQATLTNDPPIEGEHGEGEHGR